MLIEAVKSGNLDDVRSALEKGDNIHTTRDDVYGATALHWAASCEHTVIMDYLLLLGANKESKDKQGSTPLLWAASHNKIQVVKFLLQKGADPKAKNHHSVTPLSVAEQAGNYEVAELIRKHIWWSEVSDAVRRDRLELVTRLIYIRPDLINIKNLLDGMTSLLDIASELGHVQVVQLLLENGAEISTKIGYGESNESSALRFAAINGHTEVMQALLKKGASSLASALHEAAKGGHVRAVELLLEYGADILGRDRNGLTALHEAAWLGWVDVVQFLLVYAERSHRIHETVNATNISNWTPLHQAVWSDEAKRPSPQRSSQRIESDLKQVVALFMSYADIRIKTTAGNEPWSNKTPLEMAYFLGKQDVAIFMLIHSFQRAQGTVEFLQERVFVLEQIITSMEKELKVAEKDIQTDPITPVTLSSPTPLQQDIGAIPPVHMTTPRMEDTFPIRVAQQETISQTVGDEDLDKGDDAWEVKTISDALNSPIAANHPNPLPFSAVSNTNIVPPPAPPPPPKKTILKASELAITEAQYHALKTELTKRSSRLISDETKKYADESKIESFSEQPGHEESRKKLPDVPTAPSGLLSAIRQFNPDNLKKTPQGKNVATGWKNSLHNVGLFTAFKDALDRKFNKQNGEKNTSVSVPRAAGDMNHNENANFVKKTSGISC